MPRRSAVQLIETEVLPRLDKIENNLKAVGIFNGHTEEIAELVKEGLRRKEREEAWRVVRHEVFGYLKTPRLVLGFLAAGLLSGIGYALVTAR